MPTDDELAASGFTREDYDEHAEVWPENWAAWCLFAELDTQWHRAGMNGARTGLMYAVLWERLDRLQLTPADWLQLYDDVRVLEQAALVAISKHQK